MQAYLDEELLLDELDDELDDELLLLLLLLDDEAATQKETSFAPIACENVPSGHLRHVELLEAPGTFE